jgi:hypothetical protein
MVKKRGRGTRKRIRKTKTKYDSGRVRRKEVVSQRKENRRFRQKEKKEYP